MAEERLVDFWARTMAARSPLMLEQLRTVARSLLAARQALRSVMPDEFIHSPGIDLLFTLFAAENHVMPVPALLAAAPVSTRVAQRWLDVFVDRDLVSLRGETIVLSEAGFEMMAEACQAIIESQTDARATSLN